MSSRAALEGINRDGTPEREHDLSAVWLSEIGLSSRNASLLAASGMYVVSDVAYLSDEELRRFRNVGTSCIQDLRWSLAEIARNSSAVAYECANRVGTCYDPSARIFSAEVLDKFAYANIDLRQIPLAALTVHNSIMTLLRRARLNFVADLTPFTNLELVRLAKSPNPKFLEEISGAISRLSTHPVASEPENPAPHHKTVLAFEVVPSSDDPALDAMEYLARARDSLEGRHREVLNLRFGLGYAALMTLEETGQSIGLTRERVRQIEAKALDRMRAHKGVLRPAVVRIEETRQLLGLSRKDSRLVQEIPRLHQGNPWKDESLIRLLWAVFDKQLPKDSEIEGLDTAVVAVMSGREPMTLSELGSAVRPYLHPDDMARFPTFSVERRIELLGPAIRRNDGRFELPSGSIVGVNDKRIRRLQAMRSVLERLGPSHYMTIAKELDDLLPTDYRMSANSVRSWLDRYAGVFVWAGPGTFGLKTQGVGIRADERATALEPAMRERRGTRARRRGVGDEIADLLREFGPLPLSDVEAHILSRFRVQRKSVLAAIKQDRSKRFSLHEDRTVSLCT